jgi:hypothetical protein
MTGSGHAVLLAKLREALRQAAELLYACIEPSLGSRELFLNKAIG